MADQELKEGLEKDREPSSSASQEEQQTNSADVSVMDNDDDGGLKEAEPPEKGTDGSSDVLGPMGQEEASDEATSESDDNPSGSELHELESEDLDLSITDDELWDEGGGLDEIPLFDQLEATEQKEERGVEAPRSDGENPPVDGPGEVEAAEAPKEAPGEIDAVHEEEIDEQISAEEGGKGVESHVLAYVPFIFSGLNVILFIAGLVVLVNLLTSPQVQPVKSQEGVGSKNSAVEKQAIDLGANTIENGPSDVNPPQTGFYTMTLDPFIIPAQLNGELVFFKLKAELVFGDALSKRAFSQRESALRDIIYSELKGIDITAGLSNKSLFSYRRPIIKKLNEYFAPHKVKDIRLVGFVLK